MSKRNTLVLVMMGAGLIVAAGASLARILRPDTSRRNFEFLPEMVDSPAYATNAPNPNFTDGSTQRPPPRGTIARGVPLPLHYPPTTQGAARAGAELTNPFAPDQTVAVARGQRVFADFCLPCHGAGGAGDGLVAKRGYPPPPSLLADAARQLKDGEVFHLITYGRNNMPAHAALVGIDDRWRATLYVRSLQQASPAATAPTTAPSTAPAVAAPGMVTTDALPQDRGRS